MLIADNKLIELLKSRPDNGLDKLIDIYSGLVYTIVYGKLSGNCTQQDIEECISDVFYEFYKSLDLIDLQKGSIKAYLAVIAKRRAIDAYRKSVKYAQVTSIFDEDQADIPAKDNVDAEIINREAKNILIREIDALGKPDSEIFIRKYYLGQSTKLIAKAMHLRENTVDKKVSRGLTKLRQSLGGDI